MATHVVILLKRGEGVIGGVCALYKFGVNAGRYLDPCTGNAGLGPYWGKPISEIGEIKACLTSRPI